MRRFVLLICCGVLISAALAGCGVSRVRWFALTATAPRLKVLFPVNGLCRGISRSGRPTPAKGFTSAQVCASVGPPNVAAKSAGGDVVWEYYGVGTIVFRTGRAVEAISVDGFHPTVFLGPDILGRTVAMQSGCGGCHRFGTQGNDGPGPPLTHVGSRLSPKAIARILVDPSGVMPSFKDLPQRRFDALVLYLSKLR